MRKQEINNCIKMLDTIDDLANKKQDDYRPSEIRKRTDYLRELFNQELQRNNNKSRLTQLKNIIK